MIERRRGCCRPVEIVLEPRALQPPPQDGRHDYRAIVLVVTGAVCDRPGPLLEQRLDPEQVQQLPTGLQL